MKKTIASIALLASTSGHAIVGPHGLRQPPAGPQPEPGSICVWVEPSVQQEGTFTLGSCDMTRANRVFARPTKADGCPEEQAAIRVTGIQIESCPAPVQL